VFKREHAEYFFLYSLAVLLALLLFAPSIRLICCPFGFSFLADGLLSLMIAQHTLCIVKVLVAGNCGIDNVQALPIAVGILVLTQHDFLLATVLLGLYFSDD
jgi:hypothetical protein